MRRLATMAAVSLLALASASAQATNGAGPPPDLTGTASALGDTVIRVEGREVQLWGIRLADSPTLAGDQARRRLEILFATIGNRAQCFPAPSGQDEDADGRPVRQCFVAGVDLARFLVEYRHAVDWPEVSAGFYAR